MVVIFLHPFSKTISALLNFRNSFQQLSKLFHLTWDQLFSTLPCSSQLLSTTLTSCLFNSSHLFSPPLNSSHLFLISSQLFSPSQLWPTLLNSSHPLSQRCLHTEQAFTQRRIYTQQALTQRSSYTQKLSHPANFCTEKLLHTANYHTGEALHREAFTHSNFYTQQAFTQRSFYAKQVFAQRNFYIEKVHIKLLHEDQLLHRRFYTEQTFHRASVCTEKLSHREALHKTNFHTQQANTASFCTEKLLHKASFFALRSFCTLQAFTERSCYSGCPKIKKFLLPKQEPWRSHSIAICKDWIAKHKRISHNGYTNCSYLQLQNRIPTQSGKTTILKHLSKGISKGNHQCQNGQKNCRESTTRNYHAAITIRFTTLSCKTQIVSRLQLQQRGTLTKPFDCDLQRLNCKTQKNFAQRLHKLQLFAAPKPDPNAKRKNDDFEAPFKKEFQKEIISAKMEKKLPRKHHS